MPKTKDPLAPEGILELGIWPQQAGTKYRYHDGQLQYASIRDDVWCKNTQRRGYKQWEGFWAWVDSRVVELRQPPPPQAEVKDEDVKLAIDYATLKHALEEIKHILKEKKPPLDEIKEIAQNALDDTEGE